MKDNGKLLLKIVSAVFMIYGVIAAIVSLIALITTSGLGTGWLISTIILLLVNAAFIIMGSLGLKKSDDRSQASFFIIIGFVLAALELLSIITYFSVWGLIGFVAAVIYIVGGYMLRNSEAK